LRAAEGGIDSGLVKAGLSLTTLDLKGARLCCPLELGISFLSLSLLSLSECSIPHKLLKKKGVRTSEKTFGDDEDCTKRVVYSEVRADVGVVDHAKVFRCPSGQARAHQVQLVGRAF